MAEQDYSWLLVISMIARRQEIEDEDQKDPRQLNGIYAQAGTFDNADSPAANDLLAALTALLVLYLISAIYRANLTVFANFCAKRSQNKKVPFSSPDPAQSLSTAGFPEKKGFFWVLLTLCQLNSTLTSRSALTSSH